MKERRRYIRILDDSEITYQIALCPKQYSLLARDISLGGMRIYTHQFIPVKTIIKLNIRIKKMAFAISILCAVQWVKKDTTSVNRYDVGLRFIDAPQDKLLYLEEYIRVQNASRDKK